MSAGMNIQTFTIVVGGPACDSRCPYCVSKMTPKQEYKPQINDRHFQKAMMFAETNKVSTVLLTGKGEPTLYPEELDYYLHNIGDKIPFIELQTNGKNIYDGNLDQLLPKWLNYGLNTIAISVAHYDDERNAEIFQGEGKKHIEIKKVIEKLHNLGFSVRLTCIMVGGYIDSPREAENMINFARENKVEQLTLLPVTNSSNSQNEDVSKWIQQHELGNAKLTIAEYLKLGAKEILTLPHGATIFDMKGQNVCLSNCLTPPQGNDIRQLIFGMDGHLYYDWQYKGAILL